VQDAGEPGAGGVPVDLLDGLLTVVASGVTDGNGDYSFTGLDAGNYTVRVDSTALPAGSVATADPDGVLDDETVQAVVLGDAITGLDFGYQPPVEVSGVVWIDANGDGVRDPGEPELGGVIVSGICAGPDGILGTGDDAVLPNQVTTGSFTFSPVPVSTCEFTVDPASLPPGSATSTFDLDGGADGTSIVVVPPGGRTDVDFGYQWAVDLLLTKVSTEGNVQAGDDAEWILTVTNVGVPTAFGTITLTDDLPDGLNFVSAGGAGWTCGEADSVVTCFHAGPLAVGDSLEVRILTNVDEDLSGTINNEAVVALAGDFNVLNNTAVAGVGLLPATGFNLGDALTWSLLSILLGAGLILLTHRRDEDHDLARNS
ncbi:MAG: DUF11 domain-containing protein, partial [Acidimicrobiia bacterium]|nr:DUF11 domain-containing protein [Acidimicrobiia bacterium]